MPTYGSCWPASPEAAFGTLIRIIGLLSQARQEKAPSGACEVAMSPTKERFVGIAGCRLAIGDSSYRLKDGTLSPGIAVTVSLLFAEPCLGRFREGTPISCEVAAAQGYRVVRSYDDAVMYGLV